MAECDILNERLPEMLAETLEGRTREETYSHVESCVECGNDWRAYRAIWSDLEWSDREVPSGLKESFLDAIGSGTASDQTGNVVSFPGFAIPTWAKAAAIFLVVGLGFFAGRGSVDEIDGAGSETPATIASVTQAGADGIFEASEIAGLLQGETEFGSVSLMEGGESAVLGVSSEMLVRADLSDPAFSRLIARAVSNPEQPSHERSRMIDWIRENNSSANANSEIVTAMLSVLRTDSHEGVRLRALDTLRDMTLSTSQAADLRGGLVEVLRNDPNPAIRIKAVDVLAGLANTSEAPDPDMLEVLQNKVEEDEENPYVRVRAAEALRQMTF